MNSTKTVVCLNGEMIDLSAFAPFILQNIENYEAGIFESMLLLDNKIRLADYHFKRLQRGLQIQNLSLPSNFDFDFFQTIVLKTINENSITQPLKIKLSVFPSTENQISNYSIEVMSLPEKDLIWNTEGWKMIVYENEKLEAGSSKNIKSNNRKFYSQANQFALESNCNDAILLNEKNQIIESTIANIMLVKNNQLCTPPLVDGEIAGVMRKFILNNFEVKEQSLTVDDLLNADEIFICNAVRTLKWVQQIGSKIYSNEFTFQFNNKLRLLLASH